MLIDFFGTLWPERVPLEGQYRIRLGERLSRALPLFSRELCNDLCNQLLDRARKQWYDVALNPWAVVRDLARERGLQVGEQEIDAIRAAMSFPIGEVIRPFEGAQHLLLTIRDLGLRCVIVSNTSFRTGQDYQRDFEVHGLSQHINAIVSSVDVGFRKPRLEMFETAITKAGCTAEQCIYVGNSERDDVQPAVSLGMRVIRVAIEEAKPVKSAADAVVTSLPEAAEILRSWV